MQILSASLQTCISYAIGQGRHQHNHVSPILCSAPISMTLLSPLGLPHRALKCCDKASPSARLCSFRRSFSEGLRSFSISWETFHRPRLTKDGLVKLLQTFTGVPNASRVSLQPRRGNGLRTIVGTYRTRNKYSAKWFVGWRWQPQDTCPAWTLRLLVLDDGVRAVLNIRRRIGL
jgi:hypothetical protein